MPFIFYLKYAKNYLKYANLYSIIKFMKGGETVKEKIRSIMILNGYKGTIKEIAKIFGISESSVVNRFKGKEDFKIKEIRKFADAFKLSDEQICDIFIRSVK